MSKETREIILNQIKMENEIIIADIQSQIEKNIREGKLDEARAMKKALKIIMGEVHHNLTISIDE